MAASRNPIELEAPVDRKEPDLAKIADKKIKRIVKKAAKGTPLKPVFETVVQRTRPARSRRRAARSSSPSTMGR
jgi:inorganic triphosphatase YgiF